MKLVKIKDVRLNPSNPRIIKDDKFAKLVQSLTDFPEMATVRPIVCNTDMVILGGNMRFKAMQAAGWKEVPVQVVDWPDDKQAEFVIKDNVSGGEWDWDALANEWDAEKLEAWGLSIPQWANGHEINNMNEHEISLNEPIDVFGDSDGKHRVMFIFDSSDDAERYFEKDLLSKVIKNGKTWKIDLSTQSI